MAANLKYKRAMTNGLKDYLGLFEDERLLIIADENKRDIGLTMMESAKKLCEEVVYTEIPELENDGDELMHSVAEMMKDFDAVVSVLTKSISHTKARKEAALLGVRVASMPDINEDTIARCLAGKPDKLIDFTSLIAKHTKGVLEIRVTSERGTNIVMPVRKRRVISKNGVLVNIGDSGNIPSGVVHVAPHEKKSDGIIVFDGSVSGVGLLKTPIKLDVIKGNITKISGKTEAKKLEKLFEGTDENAKTIARFGIGTNPKAEIKGTTVEDLCSYCSIHIGFGHNTNIGGKNDSNSYIVGVIDKPTVYFDDIIVIDDGVPVLED